MSRTRLHTYSSQTPAWQLSSLAPLLQPARNAADAPLPPHPSLTSFFTPRPLPGVWGRPEDKTAPNPVYTLTRDRPGSDVTGAMAAALGAASVVFKDVNPAYSQQLLAAALKAYDFATKNLGLYNNAIPDAANFYRSSNMYDDMAFAAIWLYVRTGDVKYKTAARALWDKHWNTEDGKGVWNNYGACWFALLFTLV